MENNTLSQDPTLINTPQEQAPQEQAQEQAQAKAQAKDKAKAKAQAKAKALAKAQAKQAEEQAQALKALLDAKVAKALAGITPEMAMAKEQERQAKLSNGAKQAWATRRANGNNGSSSAKQAWATRRAIAQAMADLIAKAQPKAKGKRSA